MQDSWTKDDNISLVVLQLDPETGEGTGEMIVGAGFGVNKKTGQFEIESMASNPIKFSSVKKMDPELKKRLLAELRARIDEGKERIKKLREENDRFFAE